MSTRLGREIQRELQRARAEGMREALEYFEITAESAIAKSLVKPMLERRIAQLETVLDDDEETIEERQS